MAVRLIVCDDRTCDIIELYILIITNHEHIVAIRQQLLLQTLGDHQGRHRLRRTIGEGHAAGNGRRSRAAGGRRTAGYLFRSIRMAQGPYRSATLRTVACIDRHGNALSCTLGDICGIEDGLSGVDLRITGVLPVQIQSDFCACERAHAHTYGKNSRRDQNA